MAVDKLSSSTGIISKGTSGIWTYIKYADGTAMCWGTWSGSVTLATVVGDYHRGSVSDISFPSSLFNAAPNIVATCNNSTYWIAIESNSTTKIERMHVYDIVNGTATVKVALFAVGKWK